MTPPSFVYFIKNGLGAVKIGFSCSPKKRLETLQRSSGEVLELVGFIVGDKDHERSLHRKFDHLRIKREWFRLDHDLQIEIDRLIEAGVADALPCPPKRKAQIRAKGSPLADAIGARVVSYLRSCFPIKTAACVADATGLQLNTVSKSLERGGHFSTRSVMAMTAAFGPTFLANCYPDDLRPPWLAREAERDRRATIERQIAVLEAMREAI